MFSMISNLLKQILRLFLVIFRPSKKQSDLVLENLALRQQLSIYRHTIKRPKIRNRDRIFWVFISRLWKGWKNALIVVKPETVIRWHKSGLNYFGDANPGKEELEGLELIRKQENSLRI